LGPSFPSGDFEDDFAGSSNDGSVKMGGTSSFIFGYSFKENFGISVSFSNTQYNIKYSNSDKSWNLVSFMAGPMFSVSLRNSFFLDLKPMIRYTNASLNVGDNIERSGNGFSIYPSTSLRYNFSRRWSALAETGFLISNQNFGDSIKKMQAINFCFGIGYRFL
jgi:hypothetical protein